MTSCRHQMLSILPDLLTFTAFIAGCRQPANYDSRSDSEAISTAESEVYAAVVRDILSAQRAEGQTEIRGLVFNKSVETDLCPGADPKACEDGLRRNLANGSGGKLNRELIDDFIYKSRLEGPLSTKFRTDLSPVFVDMDMLFRKADTIETGERKILEKNLRTAGGIISLSHVGFDRTLHHAIVASSFYCGMLCGSGRSHLLQKKWGKWIVVKSWTSWIS